MAQIVTITNPLTGQPAQVDQLEHTAQEIDDAIARALPGGAIDITLQNKLGGIESTEYPGCYYRTVDGVIEWLNPPMRVGGIDADGNPINEYRTTERYRGKPVYTKLVDCGPMPSGTTKTVDVGVKNLCHKLSVKARMYYDIVDNWTLPLHNGSFDIDVWFNNQGIGIMVQQSGLSAYTCYATIKYTKTTD